MTTVGVRELKNQLSRYLKRVRAGERLVVTERGEPVAIISPPVATETDRRVEAMLRQGVAQWAGGKPRGARRPPRVRGRSVADAVIEGRR
jgi:prevent-host-death family protein